MADDSNPVQSDSPEARRYNRIRRWLGIADFVVGFAFLIVLLVTGWSGWLRDLAYRLGLQNYPLSLFVYLLLLLVTSKGLGIGLDYYGFLLERRFRLSTQRFRPWAWDEVKGFLVGLVLGSIVVEVLYLTVREWPQHWWMLAWALFMVLFVVLAQLAPVVLFPIFYKFEPLDNEDLRRRLMVLSERAGTRVRGVYRWKLSEKSKKANAALTGLGATRRIILADTLLDNYTPDEIEAVLAHELGHHVHRHILKSIFVQAANHSLWFLGGELGAPLFGRPSHVRGNVRLRQPALAGAGFRSAVIFADACTECVFPLQRAAGGPVCFRVHLQRRAFHHLDEQTGGAEPGGANAFEVGGMVFPFASCHL